jgi:membrane-associated phospholipid phosphatase
MLNKLIFIFIFFCAGKIFCQNLDFRILKAINKHDMRAWDKGMRGLSNSVNPLIPVTVVGIWTNGYLTKDKVMMRNGYKSAITIGFAALVSSGLKVSIARLRPEKKYPGEFVQRTHSGRYSFPSGHTTSAFAMATSLSLSYKKWYVALPAYLYAGMVGYSRMRLGVHFPSDVLGGMVIGVGSGLLVWQLDRLINKK